MTIDPTLRLGEILRPADTTAPASTSEPTLTLSQLQSLLREAAAYERAQRPIVLHTATAPVAAPAPHPGIEVRIPAAPVGTTAERRDIWPLVFMVSGCTGLASGTTAIATSNPAALAFAFAALAAWGTATYHLVFGR
jgi:hypothetical protein